MKNIAMVLKRDHGKWYIRRPRHWELIESLENAASPTETRATCTRSLTAEPPTPNRGGPGSRPGACERERHDF